MSAFSLDPLDLAALLSSRICHDVISPVGAIVNGLEVLEENDDEDTRVFALDLIKKSASQASAKLRFCRLAYGAAGSAGAAIDTGDAEAVTRGLFGDEKVRLEWAVPRVLMPKNLVKLILNLSVIAAGTIPRGGVVGVMLIGSGDRPDIQLRATGQSPRVNHAVPQLLAGEPENPALDAHAIQPYFTGLVAKQIGYGVALSLAGDTVTIDARPLEVEAAALASPPAVAVAVAG